MADDISQYSASLFDARTLNDMSSALSIIVHDQPIQPDVYGGSGELHRTLEIILGCLFDVKDLWASGNIPEGYFELEKTAHSLSSECEKLKALQATPFDRRSSHHSDIWNVIYKVVRQCLEEAAYPLKEYLDRSLSDDGAYPETGREFLHLLKGYEDMIRRLGHFRELLCVLRTALELDERIVDAEAARDENKVQNSETSQATLRTAELAAYQAADTLKRHADQLRSTTSQDDEYVYMAIKKAHDVRQFWHSTSKNIHFTARASANNYYIGQKEQLEEIAKAFGQTDQRTSSQKRFVIQGLPGSGKTEMALKYATEHRGQFWGVFWVDASSEANATRSFTDMAKVFGESSTEQAAKQHLASRHPMHPWLLIIDNADDDAISLESLAPPGNNGYVLVTTRNPAKRSFGTAGDKGHLVLNAMREDDASDLLLTAAQYKLEARSNKVMDAARNVCLQLHYLPLALMYAGKAIHHHALKVWDYMRHFDREAAVIRERWSRHHLSKDGSSYDSLKAQDIDDNDKMSVFASFELLTLNQLKESSRTDERFKDAIQLLQIFSFMHFENIRIDFLIEAALNPAREVIAQAETQEKEKEIMQRVGLKSQVSWAEGVQKAIQATMNLFALPVVLPEALKNPRNLDVDDLKGQVESRVRSALRVLSSRSLITRATRDDNTIKNDDEDDYGEEDVDMYTMHPLVHQWVRERPSLSVAKQALFCQYALTVLSNSVRLIGSDEDQAMVFRRALKPHIEKVLKFSGAIESRIQRNLARGRNDWWYLRGARWATKLWSGPWQAQMQIGQHARFGRVFLECGAFKEAEDLLSQVHEYLMRRLGPDHQLTLRAKLGLAKALLHQTRRKESVTLIRKVHASRLKTLGPIHPQTIDITVELAETILSQGRITESFGFCQEALTGLRKLYGETHRKTIYCVALVGQVQFFYNKFEECLSQHREVARLTQENDAEGAEAVPELEKLTYDEQLAEALMFVSRSKPELSKSYLAEAEKLIEHVVKRRERILGRWHPVTLWGRAHHGRIVASRWQHDPERLAAAADMLSKTLEVARRDLGDGHLGVAAGKMWYAEVLTLQGRLEEAERYLREAANKDQYVKASDADGEHVDRIWHVWALIQCLELRGKYQEALDLCDEMKENLGSIGGHGLGLEHRINHRLDEKIGGLKLRLIDAS